MANIICQHIWHRPFDEAQDRLRSSGQYRYDKNRVYILVDNGPTNSQDVSTTIYKWNGERLSVSATLTSVTLANSSPVSRCHSIPYSPASFNNTRSMLRVPHQVIPTRSTKIPSARRNTKQCLLRESDKDGGGDKTCHRRRRLSSKTILSLSHSFEAAWKSGKDDVCHLQNVSLGLESALPVNVG